MSDEAKAIALEELRLAQQNGDFENAHWNADAAILRFLRAIGHGDLVDEWEKIGD